MVFQTERLVVKKIEEIHRNEFVELLTAEEIISAIPQEKPSEENVEMKFQIALSFDGDIVGNEISLLGVFEKNKNELIGLAGFLTNDEEERELGYRFRKDFWGKGYASEITKEMINHSFSLLKFEKITADVWVENIPSNKVLNKFLKPVKEFHNEKDNCTDRRYELLKKDWQ
ncbi:GNAT family N-acetyltransferase [Tenacibaculum aiptasiae]|uniref:GNAT family N-acetyltransferase n=1 Tax=Tenacibaculum aiptasiae TaxID=426481 RepID=UPI00232C6795|nr:GNAT family N-acetyltransferase [Tenacibaculum aiptasiae]